MTRILADRASEKRAAGEALIREADDLACQSWNERMWADGGPIDPSPTIDQAINGGYAWLENASDHWLSTRAQTERAPGRNLEPSLRRARGGATRDRNRRSSPASSSCGTLVSAPDKTA